MSLKEKIENNLTLHTLGLLLAGFVAGIGTYKFMLDTISTRPMTQGEYKTESWEVTAKNASWLPLAQCPAFPLELKLASPGDGSTIAVPTGSEYLLSIPIVVAGSRPLPTDSNVGIVIKPMNSPNYYVLFPGFLQSKSAGIYRWDYPTYLPFSLQRGVAIELRAIIVDDKRKIGEQFSSIEQIKSLDPSVFVSEPSTINIQ